MKGTIKSTGYGRDPRIVELRAKRNLEDDMSVIFECSKNQIAKTPQEINKNTKAYLGKLAPGISDLIQEYNVEHIYTSFPEEKIILEKNFENSPITLGEFEKKTKQYNKAIRDKSLKTKLTDYSKDMIQKKEFATLKAIETMTLIRLKISSLFADEKTHTTEEIYERAEALGFELCPPETGPNYRLKYKDQPLGEWFLIGMKQITDRDGYPDVFGLARFGGGLWLHGPLAPPERSWDPGAKFVFRLRKKNLKT